MKRLGVLLSSVLSIEDMIEIAKLAEEQGLDGVFVTDLTPGDGYIPITAIASATTKVNIGICVASIYPRHPMVTAATAMRIDEFCGGRFILGLGTGGWHMESFKIPIHKPILHMRECFEILRRSFIGKPVSFSGQFYKVSNWDFGIEPIRKNIPLYLGAMGPNMIRLAGEISDGLFFGTMCPVKHVKYGIDTAITSCKNAGKDADKFDSGAILLTSIAETSQEAKKRMKLGLAAYSTVIYYKHILEAAGFTRERAKMAEAIAANKLTEAASYVTDEMVDKLTVSGTAEECKGKLEEYRAVGLKLPLIYAYLADYPHLKEHYVTAIRALTD